MKQIHDRNEIVILVNSFYLKIRGDDLLGPIFNSRIPEDKWEVHLEMLADFWETNLFGLAKFKGNPRQKHIDVDRDHNYGIEESHFQRWLQLWFETIDELFEGEYAEQAKYLAKKMATGQFMAIWKQRPQNQIER
jgi:hemoglobin